MLTSPVSEQKEPLGGAMKAASIMAVASLLSRILGYVRDVIVYNLFGQDYMTDAYNAAFSIPDALYLILVGGGLSSAFIPVFSEYIATKRDEEGWQVASIVFNWVVIFLCIGVSFCIIFSPYIVRHWLVPHFSDRTINLTVIMTRIMLVQAIMMCLAGLVTGILNSYKHFREPAFGSVLYNLGILIGGLLLAYPVEHLWPGYGIVAFSLGVVLGAAANLAIQLPRLFKIGMKYSRSFNLRHPGVRKLISLIIPIFIGLAVSQINLLINTNIASGLVEGSVSVLRTSQRLMQIPIGVFAVSIALVVFPTLTAQAARHESLQFKNTSSLGIRLVLFVVIPISLGMAVLREPLVRFMYEFGGKFTQSNTLDTADALLYYCIGLFAYGVIHILSRIFYSYQDTKTPVIAGVISIISNIVLSLVLVVSMKQDGLALAYSISGIVNMLLLFAFWRAKVRDIDLKNIIKSFAKIIAATFVMGLVIWGLRDAWEALFGINSKILQAAELMTIFGVGVCLYFLIAKLLKMEECSQVLAIFKRRFRRRLRQAE